MNLFGIYAPSAAWLFTLLAPLILFYFLKLRRPRTVVPSLVLWRRVLADKRVNSPFQRFKRHMLLLLQILLLILLVLGAMQPFMRGLDRHAERVPVLVDCSASMGALDRPGGKSRLDEAKQHIENLIRNLAPDQELSLIAFADKARRLTGFTSNPRVLLTAMETIRVQDVPGKLDEAVRVVRAIGRQDPFDRCLLFSDGNIESQVNEDLSFDIDYRLIDAAAPNIGITSLVARRRPGSMWEVFVSISGSALSPVAGTLILQTDNGTIGEETFTVTADAPARFVFRVDGTEALPLTASLLPDGFDSLQTDNVAYLALPAVRPLRTLVSDRLVGYRHALEKLPDVELSSDAAFGPWDLIVTENPAATTAEAPVAAYVGHVPLDLEACLRVEDLTGTVVDWHHDSALLRHVDLRGLDLLKTAVYTEGRGAADVEARGYTILAEAGTGPFILRRQERRQVTYTILVHTDQTILPYRVAFPVLVQNLTSIALQRAGQAMLEGRKTGIVSGFQTSALTICRVTGPENFLLEVRSDDDGALPGIAMPICGRYSIAASGEHVVDLGVSLLDPYETSLGRVEELSFREDLTVSAVSRQIEPERPLMSSLLLMASVVLFAEWWWYQRRSG